MKKVTLTCAVNSVHAVGDKHLVQAVPVSETGEAVGGIVSFAVDAESVGDYPVGAQLSVEIKSAK